MVPVQAGTGRPLGAGQVLMVQPESPGLSPLPPGDWSGRSTIPGPARAQVRAALQVLDGPDVPKKQGIHCSRHGSITRPFSKGSLFGRYQRPFGLVCRADETIRIKEQESVTGCPGTSPEFPREDQARKFSLSKIVLTWPDLSMTRMSWVRRTLRGVAMK